MATPSEIISGLDRKRLAADLKVKDNAISTAMSRPTLPASWFIVVQRHCAETGKECPPELFGMKGFDDRAPENAGAA